MASRNKAVTLCLLACLAACMVEAVRPGVKNPCSNRKDGALIPVNCSGVFIQCWDKAAVEPFPQCQPPLIFNARVQGCSYAGAIGNRCNKADCASFYTGDQLEACKVCKENNKLGKYPLPNNSSAYVVCDTQDSVVALCNAGLTWCQTKKDCKRKC